MKTLSLITFSVAMAIGGVSALSFQVGYERGYKAHQDTLPSCLYILRPRGNNVKPLGIDNKEGIDWYADNIAGGGLYVNLAQWKRN